MVRRGATPLTRRSCCHSWARPVHLPRGTLSLPSSDTNTRIHTHRGLLKTFTLRETTLDSTLWIINHGTDLESAPLMTGLPCSTVSSGPLCSGARRSATECTLAPDQVSAPYERVWPG
ncbi:hypothetical protein QQF64_004333 [Cirrhinus molitorella]|uniref:Uncharacterized protein n=1 Tax=Cirrhinus molitorella TaxID=172907 RepID=A0ABR3MFX5_9TELE